MRLPVPREPEWSITQTRCSSSRQISMKWLPPPIDPSWSEVLPSTLGCLATIFRQRSSKRSYQVRATELGVIAHPPLAWLALWLDSKPLGTARSISARISPRLSGSRSAVSEVRTAIIPQPMSTPTAAGTIACLVAITEPTVAPLPQWTSGIPAMWLWTKGSDATLRSCCIAPASKGWWLSHSFSGTPDVWCSENLFMALILIVLGFWSGWPGSNRRLPASRRALYPTELHPERRAQRSDPSPGWGAGFWSWAENGRVHSGRAFKGDVGRWQARLAPETGSSD